MIEDRANIEFLVSARMKDIERISRANGFLTDVRTVLMPDWKPDDAAACLTPDAQAVMLWPDISPIVTENSSELRPALGMIVVQSFKERTGLSFAMLRGMEDLRTVMYSNLASGWPGSTAPNAYGLFTRQTPGQPFVFQHYGQMETMNVGLLWSHWTFDYRRGLFAA